MYIHIIHIQRLTKSVVFLACPLNWRHRDVLTKRLNSTICGEQNHSNSPNEVPSSTDSTSSTSHSSSNHFITSVFDVVRCCATFLVRIPHSLRQIDECSPLQLYATDSYFLGGKASYRWRSVGGAPWSDPWDFHDTTMTQPHGVHMAGTGGSCWATRISPTIQLEGSTIAILAEHCACLGGWGMMQHTMSLCTKKTE